MRRAAGEERKLLDVMVAGESCFLVMRDGGTVVRLRILGLG